MTHSGVLQPSLYPYSHFTKGVGEFLTFQDKWDCETEKKRSLPDWLPAGWKVEFRKGKKEKWYSDPSKGLKFNSKVDVLCYLSTVGSNCSKSSDLKEMKKKDTGKFSTEKAASEGLPPGWIKEMRVRRKGHKIRKDPYYIDPVSGQTFRSMKEVSRFLETRESGRFDSQT